MMDEKHRSKFGFEESTTTARPKIEIVRVPSIERTGFRPLDGVQLRAAYSHVRIGTYCPEPEPMLQSTCQSPAHRSVQDVKPPTEQSKKYKKNLGPVSRLLRRRHHATSLATKSCDNIYSANKANSFFEWKHARSGHDQDRQSNSLDWRMARRIDKNTSNLEYRKASRSAEQLSRNSTLQTPSTKSKIVSLLKRLSPRLPRPNSKNSLPSSPSMICPWLQVEYSNVDTTDATGNNEQQQQSSQETDYSFQRELQLNEMRKRAIKASNSRQTEQVSKEKRCSRSCAQSNVHIQEKQDKSNPNSQDVHEDRVSSEERKEVAGPGEPGPLPRTSRRSRPHSLAVQPLNYQRLDPDLQPQVQQQQQQQPVQANKHPNMTSQESIGSCSLDVERSASDRSGELNAGSLSDKTLHSLNLECNGDEELEIAVKAQTKPRIEVTQEEEQTSQSPVSNGHQSRKLASAGNSAALNKEDAINGCSASADEQLTSKKPSYLGLACSINGYTGITRYDSKLREGFRSRDSSPGTRLLNRDTSPIGFRSNETINASPHSLPPKSQSISPLAMDRHQHSNGFANGLHDKRKIESYLETTTSTTAARTISSSSTYQGYSEVDRGFTSQTNPGLSPIRASSGSPSFNNRQSPVGARIAAYNQHNKSFSSNIASSSPKSTRLNVSHTSYTETSILNGSSDQENGTLNSPASSEKSFIQQRVERLYGPGALAQGFFFKRSTFNKLNLSDHANESSNNNNTSIIDDTNVEQSLKNLPVLRHLRPEFRAQLPVVSPRRPTDGTEQIIKPLKRISVSPAKNDAKETKSSPVKIENNATNDSKMTASVTSLTDQQPAAPKVVLPVLEPSASSTIIPKGGAEPPKEVQEKDGHYFMNLLNKERDRLIVLAEGAEAELESSGAALPEEASGKLRSAAGKARLLATQKMKQFEGLCQKNINQVPGEEFPTTSEDLAGFWDMVMLQVVQVNDLFELLERSKKSQWQEILPEQKSTPATPQNGSAAKRRQTPASKAKSAASSEAARKAREAREQTRRQLLEERRRAMRSNASKSDNSVEIFVPDT